MNDAYKKARDEAAAKERIYQPKYGGKDHSGYETMMKYEVNDEREDAFCIGADWGYAQALSSPEVVGLYEAAYKLLNVDDSHFYRQNLESALAAFKKAKGDIK